MSAKFENAAESAAPRPRRHISTPDTYVRICGAPHIPTPAIFTFSEVGAAIWPRSSGMTASDYRSTPTTWLHTASPSASVADFAFFGGVLPPGQRAGSIGCCASPACLCLVLHRDRLGRCRRALQRGRVGPISSRCFHRFRGAEPPLLSSACRGLAVGRIVSADRIG